MGRLGRDSHSLRTPRDTLRLSAAEDGRRTVLWRARALCAWCGLTAGLLGFAPSFAGQAARKQSGTAEASLRATTRLVQVSVVVRNRRGEPVTDLNRDDFTLLDGGRGQEIRVFERLPEQTAHPMVATLPPNTFSNRLEVTAGSPVMATAILLDGLNTQFADQPYARLQIVKFLEQLQPQDCVGIYALGQGLRVVHDLSNDPAALLQALAADGKGNPPMTLETEAPQAFGGWQEFNAWMEEINQNVADKYRADRALRTIRALLAIANHLERVPGRKNLIWVAGRFPSWFSHSAVPIVNLTRPGGDKFQPEIERAARALGDANVAIYPVDARGLVAPAEYSPDRGTIDRDMRGSGLANLGGARELAARTGGRAFYNTNDIQGAVRQVIDESRESYVLGYYPNHGKWDGTFREIKLQVHRPGMRVSWRRGYFALPEQFQDTVRLRDALDAAMWSPIDATRLGLTVRASRDPAGLDMNIDLDPRDITLRREEARWRGTVDLMFVQFAPEGSRLETSSKLIRLDLDQVTYAAATEKRSLALTQRLELASGATLLRILVGDVESGALGSLSLPLNRISAERRAP